MNFPGITSQIAQALSFAPEQTLVDSLVAACPEYVEWSVNNEDDPRGRLRVAVWPTDSRHVHEALVQLAHPFALSTYGEIAHGVRQVGLGVALSDSGTAVRLWASPKPSQRQAFIDVTLRAEPRLTEPAQRLADLCGGTTAYEGLSVEGCQEQTYRWTLYFTIPDRIAAGRLVEHVACPASVERDAFLKAFWGVESRFPRAFPKALIGRSLGISSGWKLYYFARQDPHRLPDPIVLDLLGARPAVREVWQILQDHASPSQRDAGLIHLVGLTIPDDTHEPRTTVYFMLSTSQGNGLAHRFGPPGIGRAPNPPWQQGLGPRGGRKDDQGRSDSS